MKVILPTALAALALTASAHAAEYRVYACDGPDDGSLSMRPFEDFEVPAQTMNHDDHCREPEGLARFEWPAGPIPGETSGGWRLRAPDGAVVTRLRWNGGAAGVAGSGARVELDTDRGAATVWASDLATDTRSFTLPAASRLVELRQTCRAAACAGPVVTTIRALSATLDDVALPTASDVLGLAGTVHGARTLSLSAADAGSGLARAWLLVEGSARASALSCPSLPGDPHGFQSVTPCPSAAHVELSWASAGERDGAHTVSAVLEDAAGNTRTVFGPATVVTDNEPPRAGTVAVTRSGATLAAAAAGFDGQDVTYAYRWQRCDPVCDDIDAATHARFTPDPGTTVRAVVTATDLGGATTVPSATLTTDPAPVPTPTATPTPTPAPTTVFAPAPPAPVAAPWPAPSSSPTPKVTLSRRTIKLPYGRRVEVRGRVTDARGAALGGATLDVLARVRKPGAKASREGGIGSAADGRFTYVAPAGPSRDLTIGGRTVTLLVSASGTLKAVRHGARVRFSGRLRGGHIPRGGVLVEIRGRRGLVALARTDGRGVYRVTTTATRQSFRARARRDSSWPFVGAPVGSPVSA